ncbi:DUF2854 domain-containing protein [Crocosphaera sp. XPORK-15E]|uniref:DUF2854 domain-containing protein n=1 Tax=Crocosphaera sp. XPORK-15E TaxID=3110247 RepID=UPI002B218C0C|nr:DUF2854 domain-containing protein [Crocosphaera sp. XPORK-15E]MEA5533280.1 DUF2854 domain-containing protein [Crocosphaera sp. XPORK-15E]
MLGQLSLARVGLTVGGLLTLMGFIAYATDNPTLNLAGFFYGVPILLGGLALKAAELKPIPFSQPTSSDILTLREKQATPTQNQIRKDVTRYRYGQEAHLDDTLERLGLSPSDDDRPILVAIREEKIEGNYALILEFNSPFITLETWNNKQEKIEKFFGPGIYTKINPQGDNQIDVALISLGQTEGN